MNTADRSLAMIDYALRRRFSFFDMEPGFDSEGFIKYQEGFANDTFNTLIDRIKELNQEIAKDKSLGKVSVLGIAISVTQMSVQKNGCKMWLILMCCLC